jgi:type IV fimbrial biogenesis protein FimT
MQIRSLQSGFTLIELMITLAVVAILSLVAGPALRDLILRSQITTATNNFISATAYARSEAVKTSSVIRVDAIDDDWNKGWQVINDSTNTVIREFDAPASPVGLAGLAVTTLRFDGRGLLLGEAGGVAMSVCHGSMEGRMITLSATGRPQLNRHYDCP